MAKDKVSGLPAKKARFAQEYMKDLNGRAAAIRAGYAPTGAHVTACRMLQQPEVKAYLEELRAEQAKRLALSADWVMTQLMDIAAANGVDFVKVDDKGKYTPIPTDQIPKDKAGAIAQIRPTVAGVEVRTYDRLKALELIGRHMGLWDNKPLGQIDTVNDTTQVEFVSDDIEGAAE